jgi:hypothetical protein
MIGQAGEHIGEPGLRVDVIELGGLDQRIDGGGAPAAFVGSGEGPVLAPDGDGPQYAFGGVVGHAQPAEPLKSGAFWCERYGIGSWVH